MLTTYIAGIGTARSGRSGSRGGAACTGFFRTGHTRGTLHKILLRVLTGVVVAADRLRHLCISSIVILLGISNCMAVMVINHIGGYILLIVRDINGSGTLVASREITPVIR